MNYKKVVVSLALSVSLLTTPLSSVSALDGTVQIDSGTLNVRSSPTTDEQNVIGSLSDDEVVQVLERKDGWAKIQTGDLIGWSSLSFVEVNDTVTFNEKFDIYDAPNGKYVASAAPNTLKILEEQDGWYKVNTWLGQRWVQAPAPDPVVIKKVQYDEKFAIYDAPKGDQVATAAPTTVKVYEEKNGWYKIDTWLGMKWIQAPAPDPVVIKEVQYKKKFGIYNAPNGTQVSTAAPTTVKVYEEQNGWYKIDTWLGMKWIQAPAPDPVVIKEVQYQEKFGIYDAPNGTQVSTAAPTTVKVYEEQSGWYKIDTWLGMKWIQAPVPGPVVIKKVQYEEKFGIYNAPNGTQVSTAAPTTVKVYEEQNGWYKIDTWLGMKWIQAPKEAIGTVTYDYIFPIYSKQSTSSQVGAAYPATLDVYDVVGEWYKVKTYKGDTWVLAPKDILKKLTYKDSISLYATRDLTQSSVGTLSAGEVSVIEETESWYKIQTRNGRYWITKPKEDLPKVQYTVDFDLYSLHDKTKEITTAKPTSVPVYMKDGNWYLVGTWKGPLWTKAPEFTFDEGITTADVLNVRSAPKYGDYVIDQITVGTEVKIYRYEGEWAYIKYGTKDGWAHTDYITDIAQKLNGRKIVLDPGHGGFDSGAVAIDRSLFEEHVNLDYARTLKAKLEAQGATVYMTRNSDERCSSVNSGALDLECRATYAETVDGDIFISIHANSMGTTSWSNTSGTELFYNTSPCNPMETWCLDGRGNPYPGKSEQLAKSIWENVKYVFGPSPRGLDGSTHYYVNRRNSVPSVLIEIGFLSNYSDVQNMKNNAKKEQFTDGITTAVMSYFSSN
ncbi:N-acetylmuramoyl-L-alanine amidase [Pontibacillus salipaludis]|uniref:SH3b domain-containing protein n=1 Tax=Pontibacillus salipaludis TaxID=1697394 RepID=A0ABQ1QK20_9BACI|nr:N-acetylmuramoyl-L-alanine amidase [Pontibacillus salipaludis]GGD28513.1 hypothetical protein GCM10011389_40080 [Pontibacillus salipaludis]